MLLHMQVLIFDSNKSSLYPSHFLNVHHWITSWIVHTRAHTREHTKLTKQKRNEKAQKRIRKRQNRTHHIHCSGHVHGHFLSISVRKYNDGRHPNQEKERGRAKVGLNCNKPVRLQRETYVQRHSFVKLGGSSITIFPGEVSKLKYCCILLVVSLPTKLRDFSSAVSLWLWTKPSTPESCCICMLRISARATASCIWSCDTWLCRYEIAPTHPYTGSRILAFASYTKLLTASALWYSGSSWSSQENS